jgi:plastocyanin
MAIHTNKNSAAAKWWIVALLAGIAFFGSYSFATARSGAAKVVTPALAATTGATTAAATTPVPGGAGCACCGTGAAAPASAAVPKAAEIAGGVQKISVDVSKGYYDPGTIELKAGVPAEITFSQASGCTAQVQSRDLGFSEDLSGGPRTVELAGLQAGTYSFECGMSMVFGSIVVK